MNFNKLCDDLKVSVTAAGILQGKLLYITFIQNSIAEALKLLIHAEEYPN